MKKKDLAEIKKLDTKSLAEKVKKLKHELSQLILDKETNKLSNRREMKNKRRDVAQILTVMRQKELLETLEGKHA